MKKQIWIGLGATIAVAAPTVVAGRCGKDASVQATTQTTSVVSQVKAKLDETYKIHQNVNDQTKLPSAITATQAGILKWFQLSEADLQGATIQNIHTQNISDDQGTLTLTFDLAKDNEKVSLSYDLSGLETADLSLLKRIPRVLHTSMRHDNDDIIIALRPENTQYQKLTPDNWETRLLVSNFDASLRSVGIQLSDITVTDVDYLYADPNFDINDAPYSSNYWKYSDDQQPNTADADNIFIYLTVQKGNAQLKLHVRITGYRSFPNYQA